MLPPLFKGCQTGGVTHSVTARQFGGTFMTA